MQSNRIVRAMGVMAVSALLNACSRELPWPFQVKSVEVLNTVEVGAVMPWYAPPIADGRAIGLLQIDLLSPVDLASFANEHSFSVGYVAYYCGSADAPRREVYSAVYPMVGGRAISGASSVPPSEMNAARGANGQIRYRFFVPLDEEPFGGVYRKLTEKSNIAMPRYDYRSNHEDLCFQIRGGDMLGRTYASEPIRVDRSQILNAVASRKLQ